MKKIKWLIDKITGDYVSVDDVGTYFDALKIMAIIWFIPLWGPLKATCKFTSVSQDDINILKLHVTLALIFDVIMIIWFIRLI